MAGLVGFASCRSLGGGRGGGVKWGVVQSRG